MNTRRSNVVPFPLKLLRGRNIEERSVGIWDSRGKRWLRYTFEELNGRPPKKSPRDLRLDHEGAVIIAPGQVWMDDEFLTLVIIIGTVPSEGKIAYRPYKYPSRFPYLADEALFRKAFTIWDLVP